MLNLDEYGNVKNMIEGIIKGRSLPAKLAFQELIREGKCEKILLGGKWVIGVDEWKLPELFEYMAEITHKLEQRGYKI